MTVKDDNESLEEFKETDFNKQHGSLRVKQQLVDPHLLQQ